MLSHQAKIDGEYAVHPSDAALEMLETVLQKLESPPLITEVMTPVENLITVQDVFRVTETMRRMREKGLSHIPLLKKERVSHR